MNIALVNLPSPFLIDDRVFPPLGILYIATVLQKENCTVTFYDFAGMPEEDLFDLYIPENFIFITVTTPQVKLAIDFVKVLKAKHPKKKMVIGGCGVYGVEFDPKLFDIVVKGEGETITPKILDILKNPPSLQVILEPENCVVFPDYLLPERNFVEGYNYKINGKRTTTMLTSRGCCFSCAFCVDGNAKNKIRYYPVENVQKDIESIVGQGYEAVMIFDDIFTLKAERVLEIGNILRKNNLIYRCFTHVNFVNDALCIALVETGCKEVGIGIESGDDTILNTIKKGFSSEKSKKAVKLLMSYGLRVKTFFMLGLPGESKETIQKTKDWLKEVQPTDFDISIYTPYPNTSLYDEKDKFDISWSGVNSGFYKGKSGEYQAFVETSSLSKNDIIKERDLIEKQFKYKKVFGG